MGRKAEEDAAIERKRRKTAEKKARKERKRLEEVNRAMDTSNNAKELQAESKAKRPKLNELEAVLEPDLVPRTPKSKDKSSLLLTPKMAKTPKTPKDNFELPADFTVIKKKIGKKQ